MMKQILTIACLFAVMTLSSCGHKAKIETAIMKSDSLQTVVNTKEAILANAFKDIEDIATSLSEITEREKIVATVVAGEMNKSTKSRIAENINSISELLQKNREAINRLSISTQQLKKANLKIESLDNLVTSLQKQLEEKDVQLSEMAANLANLKIEISELKGLNEVLTSDKANLETTVANQTVDLNTVYWIMGQQTELAKNNMIDKKGFIGRTVVLNNVSNLEGFTKGDLREIEKITIDKKGVKIISSHPADSYQLETDDKNIVKELIILNKEIFWKTSKILVLSYR